MTDLVIVQSFEPLQRLDQIAPEVFLREGASSRLVLLNLAEEVASCGELHHNYERARWIIEE